MLNATPNELLKSHPLSTTEASDKECGEEPIYVTPRVEWIARIDIKRHVVKTLGKHLNKVYDKFKTIEYLTL